MKTVIENENKNREIIFKAITQEGNIIHDVGKIEFFTDGGIIVNDEIPIKKLIEYTGMNDKNGKEIYEGYVVKYPTGDPDKPFMEEAVEYKAGAFYPVCKEPSFNFEIIGNIYEK